MEIKVNSKKFFDASVACLMESKIHLSGRLRADGSVRNQ